MKAYYNENEPYAAQWLRNLISANLIAPGDVDERSIKDVRADDLRGYSQAHFFAGIGGWSAALRAAGWPDDRSAWTGSCPCQPFSVAGKRKAQADDRHLWPEWARLIRERRPERIFGEQVEGAVGHGWLDGVFGDLEAEGYTCGAAVLGAHSVGAPHIRQRLWWSADCTTVERSSTDERLAHARSQQTRGRVSGSAESTGEARQWARDQSGGSGDTDEASEWRECLLISCLDGKFRRIPAEPSFQPLVDGLQFRVGSGSPFEGKSRIGLLRAYGNAIVPTVAAEFIRAYLECRP